MDQDIEIGLLRRALRAIASHSTDEDTQWIARDSGALVRVVLLGAEQPDGGVVVITTCHPAGRGALDQHVYHADDFFSESAYAEAWHAWVGGSAVARLRLHALRAHWEERRKHAALLFARRDAEQGVPREA